MEVVRAYLEKAGVPKRLKGFDYLTFVIVFTRDNPLSSMKEAYLFVAEKSGTTGRSVSSSIVYALSYVPGKNKPKDFIKQAVFELGGEGI